MSLKTGVLGHGSAARAGAEIGGATARGILQQREKNAPRIYTDSTGKLDDE